MKQSLLLSALITAFTMASQAAVINVNNTAAAPTNPPFTYNDLQAAITAASDGDSIYLSGTNIDYGTTTITNKTLTIIGAGYGNNLQSNFQQKSYVSNFIFSGFTGTKNVVLVGLFIPGQVYNTGGGSVNNLLIDRCAIYYLTANCNTLIMRQSLMESGACDGTVIFSPTVNSSATIQNSVISGGIGGGGVNNSVWENNIFKKNGCGVGSINSAFNGNAVFINNIFNDNFSISASYCTYLNNLFTTTDTTLPGGGSGSGNVFSTATRFVNNAAPQGYIGMANFCNAVDYHLSAGSPAIGAGVGGTDIGIYGGTNPLPATAVLNGVPAMPRITEMNVQNLSVAPGGNLNVQIKAVKEN